MGFSLSLPSITRKTSNGIPRYRGKDVFILSGEGELVPAGVRDAATDAGGPGMRTEPPADPAWDVIAYRPRIESGFSLIEQWTSRLDGGSHWRVLTRDNVLWRYGVTADARIHDPQNPDRVFQWLPEEAEDSLGNKMVYRYRPEDDLGVATALHEAGRDHRTNRYISCIEYGNYFADGTEHFSCHIVFDYGEDRLADPDRPPGAWAVRPDPFSTYRSGFEIRTMRRCQAVLVYRRFHDRFDGKPFLVRALEFEYDRPASAGPPAPHVSLIRRVSETGFRRSADGSYLRAPYPPLVLGYSAFDPGKGGYRRLTVEQHGLLPSRLGPGHYLPVDLQGQGLPGFLYSDGRSALFWEPLGEGRYAGPVSPPNFPLESDLRDADLALTSLRGDGRQELVVRAPDRAGYYRSNGVGHWEPFRPFPQTPLEMFDPSAELVDMTGSGQADLALLKRTTISTWPSLGLNGYGPPEQAPCLQDFPLRGSPDARELVTFADVFGDGLSHRVRIRDGEVACWPNLGYGEFGAKVTLENAPRFADGLDPGRLFLADLDGSGTADLVYARSDRVQVFFNLNGNGFSPPVSIPLPVPYDRLSQLNFGDVYGNGTGCLILTRLEPEVVHEVYDFCDGTKPYLLTSVENQRGATTLIHYTSSVRQCLEDRRQGRPWATRLYFPVQVVERVERRDETTGTRYVTRYRHHDGRYDPQDRQFQGFGFVETWDTEEYADFLRASRESEGGIRPLPEDLYVPPVYTRTWFHTGAFLDEEAISRQYAGEYWQGDPQAWNLPASRFDPAIGRQDAETLRQAHSALAGHPLRHEVYGLDGSAAASAPYTVSEHRFEVRLVQPREGRRPAVFLVCPLETLESEYDRDPSDPRVTQEAALAVDEFGDVRRSCKISYPRREAPRRFVHPEQRGMRVTVTETAYAEPDAASGRWIGVDVEHRRYELEGLARPAGLFRFDELRTAVDGTLEDPLPYGRPFTPGVPQARLCSWIRSFYWDDALRAPLPLGRIGARGLIHHEEQAVLTPSLAQELFAGKGDPQALMRDCGYRLGDGYWWNRGLIQYYLTDPTAFFLPCRVDGLFEGVEPESSLNPATTMRYDGYGLLPVEVTRHLRGTGPAPDSRALRITAENDYHVLLPWRLVDANENVTEVQFDPLGVVVVSTVFGTKNGVPVGDAPLSGYVPRPDATFEEVLADPAGYVQNASAYFFYDLFAWAERRLPPSAVGIRRQSYVHDRLEDRETPLQVGITYGDGFGRVIENRFKTDPGPAHPERWVVSGQVTFNNKALVTERHLPRFSATPRYEHRIDSDGTPPPTVLRYDPLGRLVRTDTPKGFFSRTAFSPWAVCAYDEDDTVLDSSFYRSFPVNPTTPEGKAERAALDQAAAFFNTPAVVVLDVAGRTVRTLANDLGGVTAAVLAPIVAGSGITPEQLWEELVRDGYLVPDAAATGLAWVAETVQPYDPAFRRHFTARFGDLASALLDLLKENGLTTLRVLDAAGNVLAQTDPRLLYTNVTTGTDHRNLTVAYDMTGRALVSHSVDAGSRWNLADVFGHRVHSWDGRSFHLVHTLDRLGRPLRTEVSGGGATVPETSEVFVYGEEEADPAERNLNGRVFRHYDPAGLVTNEAYTLTGQPAATVRQVRADYERTADWTPDAMAEVARRPEFTTRLRYDALGRVVQETAPNHVVSTFFYNQAGQLKRVAVTLPSGAETQTATVVESIEYAATGQRTAVRYGNATATSYTYEDTTLRLLSLSTTGPGADSGDPVRLLQDIRCTFDPVGNVTRVENRSSDAAFCYPQTASPISDHTYDALYRLVHSTGRQAPSSEDDGFMPFCPPDPEDRRELENYVELFGYDDGGNLVQMEQVVPARPAQRFDVAPGSNRLAGEPYDANGNLLALGELRRLEWSFDNTLAHAELPDGNGEEFYLYGGSGTRVAKVERTGASDTRETVYVSGYQLTRSTAGPESAELQTVSVSDGRTRVCLIEHEADGGWSLRYQLGDTLGSVAWEVDAEGRPLNYQEYLAYGASAFLAAETRPQADHKEFRYSGKEFDLGTDLCYYGARYYSPSHGRWLSPDPLGTRGGLNPYAFVEGNPVSKTDETGELGEWAIWGIAAFITMGVGGLGARRLGHGRGVASGVFMGVVAGVVGSVAGVGMAGLAGLAAPSLATVAGYSALAAVAGSVLGGTSGQQAMGLVSGSSPGTLAVVGTLTSSLIGLTVGAGSGLHAFGNVVHPSILVSAAAGIGSAVLASGAVLGFFRRGDIRANPLPLYDRSKIATAKSPQDVIPKLPVDRLLSVHAPQQEAEEQFAASFKKDPAAAYRLKPGEKLDKDTNPAYHLVIAHGARGFVMVVDADAGGNVIRPIPIKEFAIRIREDLAGFDDQEPIKFISCFGGAFGFCSNAQVLADVTRRTVFAFPKAENPSYSGPWKMFKPR